jgi:hypothetical protein
MKSKSLFPKPFTLSGRPMKGTQSRLPCWERAEKAKFKSKKALPTTTQFTPTKVPTESYVHKKTHELKIHPTSAVAKSNAWIQSSKMAAKPASRNTGNTRRASTATNPQKCLQT